MRTTVVVPEINIEVARKLWNVIGNGLSSGLGVRKPGQMCVEAAVCYALGLPHGDDPKCVAAAVRSFKIRLNDSLWSSNDARAIGLRRVAVAQLGSLGVVDNHAFRTRIAEKTIRVILPIALRAAASVHPDAEHRSALAQAADFCAAEGSRKNAISANGVARRASNAAWLAAAVAAADAADAAADAADAAADAAAVAAAAVKLKSRDEVLTMSADICLAVLRELNSPGVALLDQLETEMETALGERK